MNPNLGLMPSILDRLVDADSAGTDARRGFGIEQVLDAIRRDLEDLLNSRQTHVGLDPRFKHLEHSIYGYGLPDLVTLNALTPAQRQEIAHKIETAIARHEPRLRDVRVSLNTGAAGSHTAVRCQVEARLAVDPSPEVAFATLLETMTGHHKVVPRGG